VGSPASLGREEAARVGWRLESPSCSIPDLVWCVKCDCELSGAGEGFAVPQGTAVLASLP